MTKILFEPKRNASPKVMQTHRLRHGVATAFLWLFNRIYSLIFSTLAEEGPRRGRRGAEGALLKILIINKIHSTQHYMHAIYCTTVG